MEHYMDVTVVQETKLCAEDKGVTPKKIPQLGKIIVEQPTQNGKKWSSDSDIEKEIPIKVSIHKKSLKTLKMG